MIVVLLVTTTHAWGSPEPPTSVPGVNFRGDFETGDSSQFSALECPHPDRQFRIVTEPVRQGRFAARIQTAPGDIWDNGSVRCLAARYDSDESEGDDYYYGFSVYFDSTPAYNLLWELHSRSDIYRVDPDLSVVPHAIEVDHGRLEYRLLTGTAVWNGSDWTGWSHAEPDIPLTDRVPVRTWIDLVIHIKFTQSDNGLLEVWQRSGDGSWPADPQVTRRDIPTLQLIPAFTHLVRGHLNDPDVPRDIPTSSLYVELGLYKGAGVTNTVDELYLDGYRRGDSRASVMAEFP